MCTIKWQNLKFLHYKVTSFNNIISSGPNEALVGLRSEFWNLD